jgi:[ribosomal protein S18]-alanine N-acetyltransferase
MSRVPFTIRDYRREDFTTLWEIDQTCFSPGIAYSREELLVYTGRSQAFTLVAESSGQLPGADEWILGFVVGESSRSGLGHIITIDVRSEARRRSIGSALLAAAEGRLRSRQCRLVRLETAVDNLAAISFYKRHGYDVIKTIPRYYSSGVDALRLEKDLGLKPSSS